MQVTEFFERVHGDYSEVKSRLLTDERILKYLKKFPTSFDLGSLQKAVADQNWTEAFRLSHTLKGICLNLGLQSLYEPSHELTENLRRGTPLQDPLPMLAAVEEQFKYTVDTVNELIGS